MFSLWWFWITSNMVKTPLSLFNLSYAINRFDKAFIIFKSKCSPLHIFLSLKYFNANYCFENCELSNHTIKMKHLSWELTGADAGAAVTPGWQLCPSAPSLGTPMRRVVGSSGWSLQAVTVGCARCALQCKAHNSILTQESAFSLTACANLLFPQQLLQK